MPETNGTTDDGIDGLSEYRRRSLYVRIKRGDFATPNPHPPIPPEVLARIEVEGDRERWRTTSRLEDADGPIPAFKPLRRDESGQFNFPSETENKARSEAIRRMFRVWREELPATESEEDEAYWDRFIASL